MAENNSIKTDKYGIGFRADGTLDSFPLSELAERERLRDEDDEALGIAMAEVFPDPEEDLDDVSDLDEAEDQKLEGGMTYELQDAIRAACKLDRLGYRKGVKSIVLIQNPDKWNAEYLPGRNVVEIEGKLEKKPEPEEIRTVLHEFGHHAQFKTDKRTFEQFRKAGLGSQKNFDAIANEVHSEDYSRKGWVDDLAGEVFAESYARFCLDMDMPKELKEFWAARAKVG